MERMLEMDDEIILADPDNVVDDETEGELDLEASLTLHDIFAKHEENYTKMLNEMEENPAMAPYAEALTMLFDYTYSVYDRTANLQEGNAQLEAKTAAIVSRISEASEMIAADGNAIETLRKDITTTHREIDKAHEREQCSMEIIDNLRRTIVNLNGEIEFREKMAQLETTDDTNATQNLRVGLERERAKLSTEVSNLSEQLEVALAYQDELETRTDATEVQIQQLTHRLEDASAMIVCCRQNKLRLESAVAQRLDNKNDKQIEVEMCESLVMNAERTIDDLGNALHEDTQTAIKCTHDLSTWKGRCGRLQAEYDTLVYSAKITRMENDRVHKNIAMYMREQEAYLDELASIAGENYMAVRKMQTAGRERARMAAARDEERVRYAATDAELLGQMQERGNNKRTMLNHKRERDLIKRNMRAQKELERTTKTTIKFQLILKHKMEEDIESHVLAHRKREKQISFLIKDIFRLQEEAEERVARMEVVVDALRQQKLQVFAQKKLMVKMQNRARMQRNAFDACIGEKKHFAQQYEERSTQGAAMRDTITESMLFMETYMSVIAGKTGEMNKSKADIEKARAELAAMNAEWAKAQREMHEKRAKIGALKHTEKALVRQLSIRDRQIRDYDKAIVALMNERDVLGAQLVRRNEELVLLYNKEKIMRTMLSGGTAHYDKRLHDIKLLTLEVKKLRQHKSLLEKDINNTSDLPLEVFQLDRDMNKERLKVQILKQQMHVMVNVHRWRKVEWTEPEVYKLLQIINILYNRVVVNINLIEQRKKKLVGVTTAMHQLKQMAGKQQGIDFYDRLKGTRERLGMSLVQTKGLSKEVKMKGTDCKVMYGHLQIATMKLRQCKQLLAHEKKLRRANQTKIRKITNSPELMARLDAFLPRLVEDRKARLPATSDQ